MPDRKTYGQFCGLARALDHVGDRWALLVVRELLLGPKRFAQLREALPGMATNVLVDRLRALEADGLVARSPHPPRSPAVTYSLTALGTGLEEAVLALVRWGTAWMASGPGTDRCDPRWAVLALRGLLADGDVRAPRGTVSVDVEGERVAVAIGPAGRRVVADAGRAGGQRRTPRAAVAGSLPDVLAVAAGLCALDETAGLAVHGDTVFARQALRPAVVGGGPTPGTDAP